MDNLSLEYKKEKKMNVKVDHSKAKSSILN